MTLRGLLAGWCWCMAATAFAQRDLKDIPAPDPAEELRSFEVADGLEVNLFAADPLIHKPIQFNFDAQGRLWVAASEVYPQIKPGQEANDKILILEDVDGDGVAEKTTVFADGLLIPTGVIFGDGGAYVANSTELLHLKDTDGDGRADSSRIVLSGFGTEDTHHILHTFRWGLDGMLYMNQSIYIHSHVETPWGVKRLNAGGIWRFRPETLQLDVLARGWVNTWGHQFDRWGQSFVTDGAGGEGINYLVPGASYATAFGASRILHGLNPGSPKYCGLEYVENTHFPDDWQGNLITHDFRGHRVCRFTLESSGSGYVAKLQPDVIRTRHVAFRPIDVAQGPDGALYVADWYNPIIQHGEVDFRDPRRDHVHGRIWRVTAKGRPLAKRANLKAGASSDDLLSLLKSPNSFDRVHAKRLLKERGTSAADVQKWIASLDRSHPQYEHDRLEGLWMLQSINVVDAKLLEAVLASPQAEARAAAVRVAGQWRDRLPNAVALLTPRVRDEHPRVRLEAVRALADIGTGEASLLAMEAIDLPLDENLDYSLWQTVRETRDAWMPLVQQSDANRLTPRGLLFAARALGDGSLIADVVKLMRSGQGDAGAALELIAGQGQPADLRLAYDAALADASTNPARAELILSTLAGAQRKRNARPAGDLANVTSLFSHASGKLAVAAIDCAGVWQLAGTVGRLADIARSGDASNELRRSAISSLGTIGQAGGEAALVELTQGAKHADDIKAAAVAALAANPQSTRKATALAVETLASLRDLGPATSIVQAFTQRKDGAALLAGALEGKSLPEDIAKVCLRVTGPAGEGQQKLAAALQAAGKLSGGPKLLSPEEMNALSEQIKQSGDPHRGEAVFRRTELNCFKCHALAGAGGRVGPELASIGGSAQIDYLVDSLLQPNKQVKEGFHAVTVTTDAGQVVTGVKVRETNDALLLRDAEDRELSIPLKSIEETSQATSLMPAGLTDKLTKQELVDLVRFLSELGKVGKFSTAGSKAARRWEALLPSKESYTQLSRTSDAQLVNAAESLAWGPVYAKVDGTLPLAELPEFTMNIQVLKLERKISFLRTGLTVARAGRVGLKFGDVEGLQLWIDGVPRPVTAETTVELASGDHRVTLLVDHRTRKTPVSCELFDAAESPAQAQWVLGK